MNTLYFVRHGENIANITKEFSCRLVDYDLTPKGILQSRQTAAFFKGKKIDQIFSSPLKRAYQTASYIAAELETTYSIVENLREVNVGELETQKPDERSWGIYNNVVEQWKAGEHETTFPGGENYTELLERFKQALRLLFESKKNKQIIAVGHGGIMATTVRDICTSIDQEANLELENNNCAISKFDVTVENGRINCRLLDWANHSHLAGEAGDFVDPYPDFVENQ